jgi:RNA polymerase sigma factor (sigma-70 family)
MEKEEHLGYNVDERFPHFLAQLRNNQALEWLWLLKEFRRVVFNWLRKKAGQLSKDSVISIEDFLEEVYANSLIQFYELFGKGSFQNVHQLKSLMFKVTDLKLKEGYRKIQKDQWLFTFTEDSQNSSSQTWNREDKQKSDLINRIRTHLKSLSTSEQELLLQYANGVELKQIAQNLGISHSACRKRKERILNKLKNLVQQKGQRSDN